MSADEVAEILHRLAVEHDLAEPVPPLPVSKPTRVRLEVARTICSAISAAGVLLVLAHVYGLP